MCIVVCDRITDMIGGLFLLFGIIAVEGRSVVQISCLKPCLRIYRPVCGSDGKTYNNACLLTKATCERGVTLKFTRACGGHPCDKGNGGCAGTCTQKGRGFTCGCKHGFVLGRDRRSCIVHPCDRRDRGGCSGSCIKKGDGLEFTCGCKAGFTLNLDGVTCRKEHACDRANAGCVHVCRRNGDLYTCLCKKGFMLQEDGKSCKRIRAARPALPGVKIGLKVTRIEPRYPGYGRGRRTVFAITRSPWYMIQGKKKLSNVIHTLMFGLKMVPRNCYATPSKKPSDPRRIYLVKNGFPKDETFIQGKSTDSFFSFSVKPLRESRKKGELPLRFVHCDAAVCRRDDDSRECTFNKANVEGGVRDLHYIVHATARLQRRRKCNLTRNC